jgi:hypothetical protein
MCAIGCWTRAGSGHVVILTSLHPANSRIVGLRPTLCRPGPVLVSRRQPIPLVTGRDLLHIPFLLNPRFFLALADPFSGSREISVIVMMRVGLVHFRARGCLRPLLLVLLSCFSLTLTLSFHSFTPAHATRAGHCRSSIHPFSLPACPCLVAARP